MLLPEGLPRGVLLREAVPIVIPAVQPGPLMALRQEQPVALRQERAEAARPAGPAGSHREAEARQRAHLSAAAARRVRALQAAVEAMAAQRLAEAVVAQRLAAPAVQVVVAVAVQ